MKVSMFGWDELVHHLETVDGFFPSSKANHLLVRSCSAKTTFNLFIRAIILLKVYFAPKLMKKSQSHMLFRGIFCVIHLYIPIADLLHVFNTEQVRLNIFDYSRAHQSASQRENPQGCVSTSLRQFSHWLTVCRKSILKRLLT